LKIEGQFGSRVQVGWWIGLWCTGSGAFCSSPTKKALHLLQSKNCGDLFRVRETGRVQRSGLKVWLVPPPFFGDTSKRADPIPAVRAAEQKRRGVAVRVGVFRIYGIGARAPRTPPGVLPRGLVDRRLPGKGNSNSHGAWPVHQFISRIMWIRNSRLSIALSLSWRVGVARLA